MISLIDYVKDLYNKSSCDDLKPFSTAVREEYYKTGNRENFEKLYFKRRDYLSSCAFLALNDDKYISQLEQIIYAVCDEYCWALPAHTDNIREDCEKAVDLFVAETSFTLAEIITVLDKKLSNNIKLRVKGEIEKRLVKAFLNQRFWWESCNMNWAAVCGGFIGGTLIYLFPQEFEKQKTRILNTINCYIDGFSSDGNCLEGADYWLYGFSAFTYFADLLYTYSKGEMNLFKNPKVEKIAGYIESVFLKGDSIVSFSDANINAKADLCLQHYLSGKYPDTVHLLPQNQMSIWGGNIKWPCILRTSLWVDNRTVDSVPIKNHISENCIIINKNSYSLAIKGGNNNEPHNHNDLGSFIFADKNGQVLCDLGSGRYNNNYFNENRYNIFCNSSLSHNVPIINGKGQGVGENYFATIFCNNNNALVDISNAYNEKSLKSFTRQFVFNEASVTLIDRLKLENPIPITERFVTLISPEIKDNKIILGSTEILFNKFKAVLKVSEESHIPHNYDEPPITVYCLDFILKDNTDEITFEIKV